MPWIMSYAWWLFLHAVPIFHSHLLRSFNGNFHRFTSGYSHFLFFLTLVGTMLCFIVFHLAMLSVDHPNRLKIIHLQDSKTFLSTWILSLVYSSQCTIKKYAGGFHLISFRWLVIRSYPWSDANLIQWAFQSDEMFVLQIPTRVTYWTKSYITQINDQVLRARFYPLRWTCVYRLRSIRTTKTTWPYSENIQLHTQANTPHRIVNLQRLILVLYTSS